VKDVAWYHSVGDDRIDLLQRQTGMVLFQKDYT
jgi:hypothetical protein